MELSPRGISTHLICPGEVSTPMVDAEIAAGDSVQRAVKLLSGKPITAERAARQIARAIRKGQFLVIPTLQPRLLSWTVRFSPCACATPSPTPRFGAPLARADSGPARDRRQAVGPSATMTGVEPSATSWRDRAFLLVLALLLIAGVAAALSRDKASTKRGPGVAPQAGETSGRAGAAALASLRYRGGNDDAYAERAAAGFAHPLYAEVPGGAVATAKRVARWRSLIEQASKADGSPIDADTLEALVYLESAGRPDASATGTAAGAVGLTQIVGRPAATCCACPSMRPPPTD